MGIRKIFVTVAVVACAAGGTLYFLNEATVESYDDALNRVNENVAAKIQERYNSLPNQSGWQVAAERYSPPQISGFTATHANNAAGKLGQTLFTRFGQYIYVVDNPDNKTSTQPAVYLQFLPDGSPSNSRDNRINDRVDIDQITHGLQMLDYAQMLVQIAKEEIAQREPIKRRPGIVTATAKRFVGLFRKNTTESSPS